MEFEGGVEPIVICAGAMTLKRSVKGMEVVEIRGKVEAIKTKIVQNTGNSPEDLRRLGVTPTPVKDHQPTLV